MRCSTEKLVEDIKLKYHILALNCFLALSLAVNLGLSAKISRLESTLRYIRNERTLKPGTIIDPVVLKDIDSEPITLSFRDQDKPTLIYIYSPSCGWCTRNLDSVRALTNSLKHTHRVVGFSLSKLDLKEYLREAKLDFPSFNSVPEAFQLKYRLGGTPATLLIDKSGKVSNLWTGAYVGETKQQIERTLSVSLPELSSTR